MQEKLENLIKIVYKKYKADFAVEKETHPNEEEFACFIEGRLSPEEQGSIKKHLISCDFCAGIFAAQTKLKKPNQVKLPGDLILKIRELLEKKGDIPILEIILTIKEKIFELLNTNGDVLVGQELMPAPLARSRQIKEFKDEINILKDFNGIRVEAKITNKAPNLHSLTVAVKNKQTSQIIKDLRITLIKDNLELESYITGPDKIVFEQILINKYLIEISDINIKLGAISLEIKA